MPRRKGETKGRRRRAAPPSADVRLPLECFRIVSENLRTKIRVLEESGGAPVTPRELSPKAVVARLRADLVSQIDALVTRGPSLNLDEARTALATLDEVRAHRGVGALAKRIAIGGPWALVVNVDMTKSLLTGEHQSSIWAKDVRNAARVRAVRSVQSLIAMGPPYAPTEERWENALVYGEAGAACALLSGVRDVTPGVMAEWSAKVVAALPAARLEQRLATERDDAERLAEAVVEAVADVPADTLHSAIYGRREKTPRGHNTPKVYRLKDK